MLNHPKHVLATMHVRLRKNSHAGLVRTPINPASTSYDWITIPWWCDLNNVTSSTIDKYLFSTYIEVLVTQLSVRITTTTEILKPGKLPLAVVAEGKTFFVRKGEVNSGGGDGSIRNAEASPGPLKNPSPELCPLPSCICQSPFANTCRCQALLISLGSSSSLRECAIYLMDGL